jgi:Spy/CpxP family protein refolding chaperone
MNSRGAVSIKAWIILFVVFALGGVTGAAINGLVGRAKSAEYSMLASREGDEYFENLRRELDLTPAQAQSIRAILDDTRGQYKAICAEVRPRYYAIREGARLRMRERLTPEQAQQFDRIAPQEDCNCPAQKK